MNDLPVDSAVLGICGYSGAGKTTLIEALISRLCAQGLEVAVIKHDAHGPDVDRPGKDSDRFFRAGADVLLRGPGEEFFRSHRSETQLLAVAASLEQRYDFVLVEGHKASPVPKVWLLSKAESSPPSQADSVVRVLPRDADRTAIVEELIGRILHRRCNAPVFGGILIGGASSRMGRPKHLIPYAGKTWLERAVDALRTACAQVAILGAGEVPPEVADCLHLSDVPGPRGPLAGILAAMRWAPTTSWIMAACDLPTLTAEALQWLLSTRRPGVWATLPRLRPDFPPEPLLALYDSRSRLVLERQVAAGNFKVADLAAHPKTISPSIPQDLGRAWKSVNSPGEFV